MVWFHAQSKPEHSSIVTHVPHLVKCLHEHHHLNHPSTIRCRQARRMLTAHCSYITKKTPHLLLWMHNHRINSSVLIWYWGGNPLQWLGEGRTMGGSGLPVTDKEEKRREGGREWWVEAVRRALSLNKALWVEALFATPLLTWHTHIQPVGGSLHHVTVQNEENSQVRNIFKGRL